MKSAHLAFGALAPIFSSFAFATPPAAPVVTVGATVGKGAGASQYQNSKGVFISVKSKSEGLALSLGLGGVEVTLD